MLSREELARIVKNEVENRGKKGEINTYYYGYYYILLDRKIYPGDNYDKEVEEGKRSPNDIYAYVDILTLLSFDEFLFHIDYLEPTSVPDIVNAYLRKMGFTIEYYAVLPPAPNLKYYIRARVKLDNDTPEYLVIDIYDIDAIARTFRIPQVVEQKLGSKPREVTTLEFINIYKTVVNIQPLLAGYTYDEAWNILYGDYIDHKKKYKDEDTKLALAYMNLFPTPYEVCYEWGAGIFIETNCLKIDLRKRLKRSS